jgi:trehalose 2-sulfotransferase
MWMLTLLRDRLAGRPPSPFFATYAGAQPPAKRYLIATTARSGSTFLCARIADYGELGFPMEFLNESYVAEFDRLFPNPSLEDLEHYVAASFTSRSGIFGVKTDWWRFQEARNLGFLDGLVGKPFDLVVHLRRRDFVAQAVSLALAVETDVWHGRDVHQDDLQAWHQGVGYDAKKLEGHARNILNQEYYWRGYIESSGAPHIEMDYEDVARDVDGAIKAVAEAFRVRVTVRPPRSEAIRQARSDVARRWRDRFAEECGDFVAFWTKHRGLISAA